MKLTTMLLCGAFIGTGLLSDIDALAEIPAPASPTDADATNSAVGDSLQEVVVTA